MNVDVIVLRAFQLEGARQEIGARLSLSGALAAELASAGKVGPAPPVVEQAQIPAKQPIAAQRAPQPVRRYTPRG